MPYGISNYEKIKNNGYYYVDKTKYIEKLENLPEKRIMFLRPRKFGKTLFTSVIENYYDKNKKAEFENLYKEKSDSYKKIIFILLAESCVVVLILICMLFSKIKKDKKRKKIMIDIEKDIKKNKEDERIKKEKKEKNNKKEKEKKKNKEENQELEKDD